MGQVQSGFVCIPGTRYIVFTHFSIFCIGLLPAVCFSETVSACLPVSYESVYLQIFVYPHLHLSCLSSLSLSICLSVFCVVSLTLVRIIYLVYILYVCLNIPCI